MGGGGGLSEHFLMLGFLIRTLPQTVDSNLLLAIAITKMQRSVHTNNGLGKLNMPHLSPSSFLSLAGWVASPTTTYKHLASLLSSKWNQPYSTIMGWLRCRLSFALLRSSIAAIRGARSSSHRVSDSIAVDLVTTVSQVSTAL